MCEGTKTTLACGHVLRRIITPCAGRSTCILNTTHRYLNDTCASCDRNLGMKTIDREYRTRHGELMKQYMVAKKARDDSSMAKIEQEMNALVNKVREDNFANSLTRGGGEVLYPN